MTQGELLGANLFAYGYNNPVNMVDPDGYKPRLTHLYHGIRTFMGVALLIIGFKRTTRWFTKHIAMKSAPVIAKLLVKISAAKIFASTAIASITTQQYIIAVSLAIVMIGLLLEISFIVDQIQSAIWEIRQFIKHDHK